MALTFTPVGWQDSPSTTTPVDSSNLGKYDTMLTAISAAGGSGTRLAKGTLDADTVLAIPPAQLVGFRNKLINADFGIDQRNAGTAKTLTIGARYYGPDRWSAVGAGGSNGSIARVAGTMSGSQYGLQIRGGASVTLISWGQIIEAAASYSMAGRTVTVSGWMKSAGTTPKTVTWTVVSPSTVTDSWATTGFAAASGGTTTHGTGTISATSGAQRFSFNVTLGATAVYGLALYFSNDVLATNTEYIYMEQVQLEVGSQSTTFEDRPLGSELALCHRYFENIAGDPSVADARPCSGAATAAGTVTVYFTNKVLKRAAGVVAGLPTSISCLPGANASTLSGGTPTGYLNGGRITGITAGGGALTVGAVAMALQCNAGVYVTQDSDF